MKSYTDLEQSKRLAEILPIESADMCFNISQRNNMPPLMTPYSKFDEFFNMEKTPDFLIPCWSLAALLDILPRIDIEKELWSSDKYDYRLKAYIGDGYVGDWFDNPVDACVDMIIELKEQKLL